MKKYISILFAVVLAASCNVLDNALEAPSQSAFADDVVFSNYGMAENSVFGIGEIMGHTNSYRARLHLFYGTNTDLETYSSSSLNIADERLASADDRIRMSEYNSAINDTQMDTRNANTGAANNGYVEIATGIERANLCIAGLRQHGNIEKDPDMAYLLGEALTYRAFYYFDLIKMWGDVPLRTEPVTSETIYLPKTDRDEIYKVILADLEEAMNYLYWPDAAKQTVNRDRMNKAFAKGLYARIALSAAGWAWRPAEGKVGTGDLGSLRLTTDPELQASVLYPKALRHLKDVIESGYASLEPSYENLWKKISNAEHMTGMREVLWVVPFSFGRGRWNYTHAYPHNYGIYTDGSVRGGGTMATANLWWKYDRNDSRRDLTVVNMRYNGENGKANWELRGAVNYWYWGKYRFEWMKDHPLTNGAVDDGVKPVVMRTSDILLMAAELAAYTNDLAFAQSCLQQVRSRAMNGKTATKYVDPMALGLGSASSDGSGMIADHNNPATILGAIYAERALEFAGEFLRKQDLIRWGLLKIALDEEAQDLEDLAKMQGSYAKYAPYAKSRVSDNGSREFLTYPIYWREKPAEMTIEFFGLEEDEIGKTPSDYSVTEPNGWNINERYISSEAFYNETTGLYRWQILYRNALDDPYPRSVWPIYASNMSTMQGVLVNDYGYSQNSDK